MHVKDLFCEVLVIWRMGRCPALAIVRQRGSIKMVLTEQRKKVGEDGTHWLEQRRGRVLI